jgi:twitching motility protein PilT
MDPHALGRLCVERKVLTEEQVEHYLEVQRAGPEWRHLGQILLEAGALTATTLAALLSTQSRAGAAAAKACPHKELGWLLDEARRAGAAAVVLAPGHPPAFRDGEGTRFLQGPPVEPAQMDRLLAESIPPGLLSRLARDGHAEAPVELEGGTRVHAVLYRCQQGIAAALRLPVDSPPDLEALGLPPGARELARHRSGLVVVTGPRGSGRTTTLRALLDDVNRSRAAHLLLVEGATKLALAPRLARISRREVGRDAPSSAAGLRAAAGAGADVVYAELEDTAAIAAALDAAHAGRLVVAGMRAPGAEAAVGRILDAFAGRRVPFAREALAQVLRGVLAQRLFPARRGRPAAVAAELLLGSPGVANTIREGRVGQIATLLRTGAAEGMTSLEESLARLYRKGRILVAEAMEVANDRDVMRRILELQEAGRAVD